MFTYVIVRPPSQTISEGISSVPLDALDKPVYSLALQQHAAYVKALQGCGVQVHGLEPEHAFPDACFVEDTAVVAEELAVITRPGALTRQGEEHSVELALRSFYAPDQIVHIAAPGTLEGGDVMRVGNTFYAGLSGRTNKEGIRQFFGHLERHGYAGCAVELKEVLHLKTGLAYLEDNLLLAAGEFIHHPAFGSFDKIIIDPADAYSANCIWVNGTVLVPASYPKTQAAIEAAGRPTVEVDTSEYRKIDGGLSCLSLRF